MNKSAPKNFKDYWHSIEKKVKSKLHLIQNQHLKINADRLDKDDWLVLLNALKCDQNNLHSIIIYSTFLNRETFPKKSRLIQNIVVNEPVFLKEPLLFTIIDAIAVCVINSQLLSTLFLEALPLNDNYAKILNNSINKQRNLQNLTLSYCSLSEENIATLCRIICKHTGLQRIDLTGSGITYNGAKEISAVIKSQKFARYSESWKQSLRYRLPNPDILPGLRRITLNNNSKIGDEGFKVICYELLDDLWIKAIDFQNCNLTNSSTEDALLLVKINPCIKIIDIRKNDISNDIIKTIFDTLKKNTNNDNDDSYEWINSSNSLMSSQNSYNTQQMSISPAIRTKSCTNSNLLKKFNPSNIQYQKSYQSCNVLIENKNKPNSITSELVRTKVMLRKVSSYLNIERNKRLAIEREHNKCKEQIEEIRTCLKQNYRHIHNNNNINNNDDDDDKDDDKKSAGTSTTTTNSITPTKYNKFNRKEKSKIKVGKTKIRKRNGVPTLKIPKKIVSNNFEVDNESFKSAKLLLLLPACNATQHNSHIVQKKPSRTKSDIIKTVKNNSKLKKYRIQSEK